MKPFATTILALSLTACSAQQLAEFDSAIEQTEGYIRAKYCPLIRRASTSAETFQCVHEASQESQDRLAKFVRLGRDFCDNPTSTSFPQLMANAAFGIAAARRATAAGCGDPR